MRIVTKCQDRPVNFHNDDATLATGRAIATNSHRNRPEQADGPGHGITAIAATAANRLTENARRSIFTGLNHGADTGIDKDGTAITTGPAIAADCDTGKETARHRTAAITAAATNGLRQDRARVFARGQDIAIGIDRDRIGIITGAATATHGNNAARAAAITATATDRLGNDTGRTKALCLDQARRGDIHRIAKAAAGSVATNGRNTAARGAVTTAAADGLGQDAECAIAFGQNAAHRDTDHTTIATGIAVATDGHDTAAGTAITATATNGLGENTVGVRASGGDRTNTADRHSRCAAAG